MKQRKEEPSIPVPTHQDEEQLDLPGILIHGVILLLIGATAAFTIFGIFGRFL